MYQNKCLPIVDLDLRTSNITVDNVSAHSKDTLMSHQGSTCTDLNTQNDAPHTSYEQSPIISDVTKSKSESIETSSTQRTDSLKWFPSSKEELLDYSAAYIQMMIMGAEMVRYHRHITNNNLATKEGNFEKPNLSV